MKEVVHTQIISTVSAYTHLVWGSRVRPQRVSLSREYTYREKYYWNKRFVLCFTRQTTKSFPPSFCPISCNTWCVEIFKEIFMFVAYGFISHSSTLVTHHIIQPLLIVLIYFWLVPQYAFARVLLCNMKRAWLRIQDFLCSVWSLKSWDSREIQKRIWMRQKKEEDLPWLCWFCATRREIWLWAHE